MSLRGRARATLTARADLAAAYFGVGGTRLIGDASTRCCRGVLLGGLYCAVRARPVADVRRDAADQHGAGRLHRAGRRSPRSRWQRVASAAHSHASALTLLLMLPLAFAAGYALQRCVLNGTLGRDPLPSLVVTFGLSIVIQNAAARSLLGRPALARDRRARTRRASRWPGGLAIGVLPLIDLRASRWRSPAALQWLFDRTRARPRVPRGVRRPRDRRADGAGRAQGLRAGHRASPSC